MARDPLTRRVAGDEQLMKWHPRAGRTEDSRTRFGQVWSDHVSEPLTNRNGRVFVVLCLIAVFQLVTIVPGMVGSEDAARYLLHLHRRDGEIQPTWVSTGFPDDAGALVPH